MNEIASPAVFAQVSPTKCYHCQLLVYDDHYLFAPNFGYSPKTQCVCPFDSTIIDDAYNCLLEDFDTLEAMKQYSLARKRDVAFARIVQACQKVQDAILEKRRLVDEGKLSKVAYIEGHPEGEYSQGFNWELNDLLSRLPSGEVDNMFEFQGCHKL